MHCAQVGRHFSDRGDGRTVGPPFTTALSRKQLLPRKSPSSSLCAGCACQVFRSPGDPCFPRPRSRAFRGSSPPPFGLARSFLPARRSPRALSGRLIHLDIKKLACIERPSNRVTGNRRNLGDGAGWDLVPNTLRGLAFDRVGEDAGVPLGEGVGDGPWCRGWSRRGRWSRCRSWCRGWSWCRRRGGVGVAPAVGVA